MNGAHTDGGCGVSGLSVTYQTRFILKSCDKSSNNWVIFEITGAQDIKKQTMTFSMRGREPLPNNVRPKLKAFPSNE